VAGNPRPDPPYRDANLHPNPRPGKSLVEEFGSIVDDLRQLNTDFGLRPYRVFSIIVRWTGGASGRGDAVVESEVEFLPTPRVMDLTGMASVATPGGVLQRGDATLREVSPRYTEDEIRAMTHRIPLPLDRDGFIEVRIDQRDGSTVRRRFVVIAVPYRSADGFQWRVTLSSQQGDRHRDGSVSDDTETPAQVRMHRFEDGR